LGKAFADVGDRRQSFQHLLQGNALKRQQIDYDEAKALTRLKRIQAVFTAELLREKKGSASHRRCQCSSSGCRAPAPR